ncbi:hypothetical protein HD554DRAFT_2038070 [Boletus coccyginus]|nr:hypothetical protein HD554DRAFT_2038070 [Boletus coccyginus]
MPGDVLYKPGVCQHSGFFSPLGSRGTVHPMGVGWQLQEESGTVDYRGLVHRRATLGNTLKNVYMGSRITKLYLYNNEYALMLSRHNLHCIISLTIHEVGALAKACWVGWHATIVRVVHYLTWTPSEILDMVASCAEGRCALREVLSHERGTLDMLTKNMGYVTVVSHLWSMSAILQKVWFNEKSKGIGIVDCADASRRLIHQSDKFELAIQAAWVMCKRGGGCDYSGGNGSIALHAAWVFLM